MRYKKIDTVIVLENGKVYRELKDRCRLIKGTLRNNGYLQLTIKNKTIKVHRLVIEAFKGKSDLTVDHINGNKHDNRLCNLQYVTTEENTRLHWERNKLAKLIDNKNKLLIKLNEINKEISEEVLKK